MSANDIRKSINILNESVISSNQVQEAMPMGTMATLKTAAKSLIPGSSAKGELATGLNANKLFDEYKQYLGNLGIKYVVQGTVETLFSFLANKSIDMQKISAAYKKAFGTDIKTDSDLDAHNDDQHNNKETIAKFFLYLTQQKSAKPKARFGTPPTPPPGAPSLSDSDIEALLRAVLGTSVSTSQVAALKQVLKNAGLIS